MTQLLPTLHRFTIDDLERMVTAGILRPDDRVELIEGELIDLVPISWPHQACVDRLAELFVRHVGRLAIVRIQGPIRLSERSLPQPDLALLRPQQDDYAEAGPTPADVLLIVEVSDTTLPYDRDTKVPLYARYGIPEVWLVDLTGQRILLFRAPHAEGYRDQDELRSWDVVSPVAFPDLSIPLTNILAP